MRPLSRSLSVALLVGCLAVSVAVPGEQECNGPYKSRTPTLKEIETFLSNHWAWLESAGGLDDQRRANLCQANLAEAELRGASLQGASLVEANLQKANLYAANLQKANLHAANLQNAWLEDTNLQNAWLVRASLQGAALVGASLAGAVFEPIFEPPPDIRTHIGPHTRLDTWVFHTSPAALITLREAFKKAGMRTQERQLTYAVEHTKMLQAWDPSIIENTWRRQALLDMKEPKDKRSWKEKLAGKSESLFSYVLFELPSDYGMAPSRALAALGLLILGFSLVYMIALLTARGRAGIWATWPPDRVYQEEGSKEAVRVTDTFLFPQLQARAVGHWWGVLLRGLCIPLVSLYFSILSAFSLGWRELNVGTWVSRMQPREYILRATGWVRFWAGLQSLLSVYLLALWVLTYFGRPFE